MAAAMSTSIIQCSNHKRVVVVERPCCRPHYCTGIRVIGEIASATKEFSCTWRGGGRLRAELAGHSTGIASRFLYGLQVRFGNQPNVRRPVWGRLLVLV